MKYYDTLDAVKEARGKCEVSSWHGSFRPSNPTIIFVDELKAVFTEQWSIEGRYRGWIEEIVSDQEYFKRKLKGK